MDNDSGNTCMDELIIFEYHPQLMKEDWTDVPPIVQGYTIFGVGVKVP